MSIKVMQRPFGKEGYYHPDFHYFTQEELANIDCETPSRSENFSLIVVLDGFIRTKLNLQDIEAQKNTVIFAAPNAVKQMIYKSDDCQFVGFVFSSTFLAQVGIPQHRQDVFKLLAAVEIPLIELTDAERDRLVGYLNNISHNYTLLQTRLYAEELIHANFLSVFYELGEIAYANNKRTPAKVTRKEAIVVKFGSLAIKHFKERKQLQFYASEIFVTAKHLTETVKEITGKTAGEILDGLVIKEAKLMLEDAGLGITEIALALNFSDQSFFGKYFKRHTGLAPREYRNRHLKKQQENQANSQQ